MTDWRGITDEREKYAAYLCSREWGELKQAVHDRAGGKCERCCRNPIDAVHHLTYIRKYAERLEDLQAICNGCHSFLHGVSNVDPLNRGVAIDLEIGALSLFSPSGIMSPMTDPRDKSVSGHGLKVGYFDDNRPHLGLLKSNEGSFCIGILSGNGARILADVSPEALLEISDWIQRHVAKEGK